MCARRLIINLLILAQGMLLWQGALALSNVVELSNAVENLACHHATHDMQDCDMQNCCDKGCAGFCHCHFCAVALISTLFAFSFTPKVLNSSPLPIYISEPLARLIKPPRNFHS